jgi:ketosteroid isomerase-like protein
MSLRPWRALVVEASMTRISLAFDANTTRPVWRGVLSASVAALLLILFGLATPIAAQKQKTSKNAPIVTDTTDVNATAPLVPLSDPQAIELMLSQMLAAWQIGDEQMLHSYYADDVLVVSGAWEPPLQGWTNYLRAYQAQRSRTQGVRLERTNTFTKIVGTAAWSTYQWEFSGQVDGAQTSAVGQTTLMLEKRNGKWLIVVNHTSVAPMPPRPVPTSTIPVPPATQPVASR